jgi:precorrin-6A/cobalt-precorrin-6A reductase
LRRKLRLLVLGGTSEANALAAALAASAGIDAVISLAGRTQRPAAQPIPTRIGGFGGVDGLQAYLRDERIDGVVDATHPFAARISRHAAQACIMQRIPLLSFTRPQWSPVNGDRWIEVADIAAAVSALGETPRRVMLTHGRLQLDAFAQAPQHDYLIRTIDPPEGLLSIPRHRLILARGPFGLDEEEDLMRGERIEIIVSKNSGGAATYAKIEAARRLNIPVVMLARPEQPDIERTHSLEAALAWVERRAAHLD